MISFDARSGYHQVKVRPCDQGKLAFFPPCGKKKTFKGMPFGPKNAPSFYTVMMQSLREKLLILFAETKNSISILNPPSTIICDDKIIMDDIIPFSNHDPTLLHYFLYVSYVFTKYRFLFKLSKDDYFKPRVEFVGYDLPTLGNCPSQSKFQLIEEWFLPAAGTSLLSFIGLCTFYDRYCPSSETNINPLRELQQPFYRVQLPLIAWSPSLISLFRSCKSNLITSPFLLRYDSSKPDFLKTDWSASGMGYIIMQSDNSQEFVKALRHLVSKGECLFELSLDGPRLYPVVLVS